MSFSRRGDCVVLASEDVGLADPTALGVAVALLVKDSPYRSDDVVAIKLRALAQSVCRDVLENADRLQFGGEVGDIVDEWSSMYGLGRVLVPEEAQAAPVDDGMIFSKTPRPPRQSFP